MDKRIIDALLAARQERDLGFDAVVRLGQIRVEIDTRISRDPRRSNNGGEYYFWLEVWPGEGGPLMQERASCDFWQPEREPTLLPGSYLDVVFDICHEARSLGIPVVES